MAANTEEDDSALMHRLLRLRNDKENRLRRQLAAKQRAREKLEQEAAHLRRQRHDLVVQQTTQPVPAETLTQETFVTYKLQRAKDYQQERLLAQRLVNLQSEADALMQTISHVQTAIQQVTRSQEKLKDILA